MVRILEINYTEAIELIKNSNNIFVLCHQNPDGDTLGSGYALVNFLRSMGKKANVLCSDQFPHRYQFMYEGYCLQNFEPQTIIAVDVADKVLLGKNLEEYKDKVDLCIDHHISNTLFAKKTLVNPKASATCEVLFELFSQMGLPLNHLIATCLYTGIATDTGCFKFENTSKAAHIAASKLMDYGVEYSKINRKMFDIKSKSRIKAEQFLSSNMEYFYDDKITMINITKELIESSGMDETDFEGVTSLTMQLESVEVGVTIKQRGENTYKLSMRSANKVNVSALCAKYDGGGHIRAAGCQIIGNIDDIKTKIVADITKAIEDAE